MGDGSISRKPVYNQAMREDIWNKHPWAAAGLLPGQWLESIADKVVVDPRQIVASARPYEYMMFGGQSGVYVLVDEDDEIAYVGVSRCVDERLCTHIEKRRYFSRVWAVHGLPELLAKQVEGFYIHALNPYQNVTKPYIDTPCTSWLEQIVNGQMWPDWQIPEWDPVPIMPAR